jgi:hypothetical protein
MEKLSFLSASRFVGRISSCSQTRSKAIVDSLVASMEYLPARANGTMSGGEVGHDSNVKEFVNLVLHTGNYITYSTSPP